MKIWGYVTIFVLAIVVCSLSAVNVAVNNQTQNYQSTGTASLVVEVVDFNNQPIDNAIINVIDTNSTTTSGTDGTTPSIFLSQIPFLDKGWYGLTVTVKRSGYVDTVIYGCVILPNQTRTLKVRMYNDDGTLPFVCYVECPPNDYIDKILGNR